MKGLLLTLVGLGVGLYVAAILIPDAITLLSNASYTGAPAAVKTMGTTILGICAVAAVIIVFLKSR